MLKLIAIVLIVAATSKIGFSLAARLERRKNNLASYKDALSLLESEISFAQNSLAKAFYNIGHTVSGAVGAFFCDAGERLAQGGNTEQVWETLLEQYKQTLCLTTADVQLLRTFAARLGKSDVKNELKNIYNTTVGLNMQIAGAKNACDTNKRVYQSAGVLCGILIAVLLI